MTVPILAIHAGARVIEMLPRTTGQPRLVERRFLSVEDGMVFDQEFDAWPSEICTPTLRNSSATFGSLIRAPIVEHQRQALDPQAELFVVALGQRRQIRLMLRRGVKLLFMEQDIVGTEDDVLHHHVLVPLELGIRQANSLERSARPVPGRWKCGSPCPAFRPPLGFPPFI